MRVRSAGAGPLVSVVIPAFNAASYITETLESILAQTYPHVEILVVDDGSTDATRERVRAFSDSVRYLYEPNSGGCSVPRNFGIQEASGEFLTFFDADDVMEPEKLAMQVDFLLRHSHAGSVLTDFENFDERGPVGRTQFQTCDLLNGEFKRAGDPGELLLAPSTSTGILIVENYTSACSPVFRRGLFARVGVFDQELKGSEDFDLQYRISSVSHTGILRRLGFRRRLHASNMSWNVSSILANKLKSRRKALQRETIPSHRRLLNEAIARLQLELGYYYTGRDNRVALTATLESLKYQRRNGMVVARNLGRIVASAVRPLWSHDPNAQ